MNIFEQIASKRQEIEAVTKQNIQKSFVNEFNEEVEAVEKSEQDEFNEVYNELFGGVIEKAVYADTAENRKLGRVGKEYHRGKGKKEGGAATPKKENKKSPTKSGAPTAEQAAKFLEENASKWMDYQYGDLGGDLEEKFSAAEKFIKTFKQFDYTEEDEAEEYRDKMENKGYKVVDVGDGSDTYVFAVLKKHLK